MRITPVHGDLPVVVAGPPPLRLVEPAPTSPAPVVARAAVSGSDAAAASDRRRAPSPPKPYFDPPLIAQRAVLGLPVGPMIAELARESGTTYAAAAAAVEREMPQSRP